jgi:putative transposase
MRHITLSEGEYYHVYNRGVDKRVVFTEPLEYKRFLDYLNLMNDTERTRYTDDFRHNHEAKPREPERYKSPLVAIGAYCLMPNHFHLYVTACTEGGISKFMQRIQTAYTMYFNQKHERAGSLFQGTFKAEHVASDVYAKYLFSYIHLNPAKLVDPDWKEFGVRDFRGVQKFLREYPYSSLREYREKRHIITSPSKFPEYFLNARDVDDHVDFWLSTKDESASRGLAS